MELEVYRQVKLSKETADNLARKAAANNRSFAVESGLIMEQAVKKESRK